MITAAILGFCAGYAYGWLTDPPAWDRFCVGLFGRNDDEEAAST